MNLKEKNNVLSAALNEIKYIVTEHCGGHPDDIEAQYYCNALSFNEIAKVIANVMRLDVFGDGLSKGTYFTPDSLTGFAKFLAVPALGMQFRRYKSANMTKLVATWRDEANSHVYEITVEPICDSPGWCATAANDGHVVFQLRTKNRTNCEPFALSAMKRYLKRGHRKTYRKITKVKEGK